MTVLVADCPRCGASKITFDLLNGITIGPHSQYAWLVWYETFCVCRHCSKSTIFALLDKGTDERSAIKKHGLANLPNAANKYLTVERYVSLRDRPGIQPPDHLPADIQAAFSEGATCLSVNCYNAAGTMFRLCVDFATSALLPEIDPDGLNSKVRRSLGLRLKWLLDKGIIPESLRELSHCIKEDGNDGAHVGSLSKPEAEDLLDFTVVLLERLYTEPKRLEIAKDRRAARRATEA